MRKNTKFLFVFMFIGFIVMALCSFATSSMVLSSAQRILLAVDAILTVLMVSAGIIFSIVGMAKARQENLLDSMSHTPKSAHFYDINSSGNEVNLVASEKECMLLETEGIFTTSVYRFTTPVHPGDTVNIYAEDSVGEVFGKGRVVTADGQLAQIVGL